MTSIRETILAECASRLQATATGLGYAFERNRLAEVEAAEMPAIVLYDGGFSTEAGDTGADFRALSVEVLAVVTGESGAALGASISAVASAIEGSLLSPTDETLGGLAGVHSVAAEAMDDPIFGEEPDAGFYATFSIRFAVRFAVAWGDPDTAG